MKDKFGTTYVKLADLKAGDRVRLDGSFTCANAGIKRIHRSDGVLCFTCLEGTHDLHAQLDSSSTYCIGVYPV